MGRVRCNEGTYAEQWRSMNAVRLYHLPRASLGILMKGLCICSCGLVIHTTTREVALGDSGLPLITPSGQSADMKGGRLFTVPQLHGEGSFLSAEELCHHQNGSNMP